MQTPLQGHKQASALAVERKAFMARDKAAAGFAIETLNAAPPTVAPGARVLEN